MRACARVALASIAVSASFSLSGCAAIEELKETFLRWVESEKLPSGRGVSAHELPEATPVVPPEKTPKEPSKRHPQPKDAARKLQRQTVMLPPKKPPIPDSTEAVVLPPKKPPILDSTEAVVLPPKKPPIPDSTEAERPEGTEGQSAPSQPTLRWLPSRWPQAPPPGRFSR
jgi:hypothetical protein